MLLADFKHISNNAKELQASFDTVMDRYIGTPVDKVF